MGSCIEHKFSYSCYVITDHHVILIFYIFLLPLSSVASSGFLPIVTIDSLQKCGHKVKGKDFLFEEKRVSYSLILYPEVGYMNLNWMCLCIWNVSLLLLTFFCSLVLQVITQVLNVLVVSLCKPFVHKLKIFKGA